MSIRRNTIFNLAGSAVPLVVSLLAIPIYLSLIGEARYGVLAVAWLLLGYFGLFDLGLGRATAQRIAFLHSSSAQVRAGIFWTALILNLTLGLLGGLLLWPVASYFFGQVISVEEPLQSEMLEAVPWLLIGVPITTLSAVLTGALQGRERFLELNLISSMGTILFQLLPLGVAAFYSVDLNDLLPAAVLARLLTLIFFFLACYSSIASGHPIRLLRNEASILFRFGGWVTVTSLVGPMMVVLDRLTIGTLAGAKAVSFYTIPFQLGERTTLLSSSLVSALFPQFASSSRSEEVRLATKGLQLLIVVTTPIMAVGIIFIDPFLAWWINDDFVVQAVPVAQILLLGFWINSFAKIPYAQLQARGRPDLVAKCHLLELVPYLFLLYLSVIEYGLTGAATVFSLRVLVDFVLLSSFSGMLRSSLQLLLLPTILMFVAFWLSLDEGLPQLAWTGCVTIYLAGVLSFTIYKIPSSEKQYILNQLGALVSWK